MLYTVFRKTPGIHEDVLWDMEYEYFTSQKEAKEFADELTKIYADDGWLGHPWHKCLFYEQRIGKEYIRSMWNSFVNQMAFNA